MTDADALRELAARIVANWHPGCWFGFVIEGIPETYEETEDERIHRPAHFLVAVWQPVVAPPLPQLPHAAAIVSPDASRAAAELLRLLPADAPVLMLRREEANAGLVADMIIAADRHLDPFYRDALEAFVAHERATWQAEIAREYSDHDEGFEHFKAQLLGKGAAAP